MKRVISGKIKGVLKTKPCIKCGKDIDLYGLDLCFECKKELRTEYDGHDASVFLSN